MYLQDEERYLKFVQLHPRFVETRRMAIEKHLPNEHEERLAFATDRVGIGEILMRFADGFDETFQTVDVPFGNVDEEGIVLLCHDLFRGETWEG